MKLDISTYQSSPSTVSASLTYILIGLLTFITYSSFSQISVTTSNTTDLSIENLVNDMLIGSGIKVTNVRIIGSEKSIGVFDDAMSDIQINQGIVLSTGKVSSIDMANNSENTGSTADQNFVGSDDDLQALSSNELKEVTGIEIEFIPQSSALEFKYVFASEEYPEFNCSKFNDIFAFFVSGPNPDGGTYDRHNIALVPDVNDPTGETFTDFPVWTNSVNNGIIGEGTNNDFCDKENESLAFSQYYNDNTGSLTFTFDGFLDVFKAKADLVPCEVYTIKIIIGDSNDFDFDSAVFLEANSLGTEEYTLFSNIGPDNTLYEGCQAGQIGVRFDQPVSETTEITIDILQSESSATADVDYQLSQPSVIVPAGESEATVDIRALIDEDIESTEIIKIVAGNSVCAIDTIVINVSDNRLERLFSDFHDQSICQPRSLASLGLPEKQDETLVFNSSFNIQDFGGPNDASIGVTTEIMIAGNYNFGNIIENICLDGISHPNLAEIKIVLQSPTGRYIGLVNPGQLSGNVFGELICLNDYIDLSKILQRVDGDLSGTWTLIIEDIELNQDRGSIDRVSFILNNPDELTYEIMDQNNDPVDLTTVVSMDDTFILSSADANGCTYLDTITITMIESVAPPINLTCQEIDRDRLLFSWSHEEPEVTFEIMVNENQEWMSIDQMSSFEIGDLSAGRTVTFAVRAISGMCNSIEERLLCGTPECIMPDIQILRRSNNTSSCDPNGLVEISSVTTKGPYQYIIDDVVYNNPIIDNLSQGDYTVTLIDGYGCDADIDFSIEGSPALKVEVEVENAYCGLQGFADLFITGGRPPFRYSWSNGSTENSAFGLDPGIYIYTITDNEGCEFVDSVEIFTSEAISIENIRTTDLSCALSNNGSISFDIVGGQSPIDISIYDSGDEEIDSTRYDELDVGEYQIVISDAFGCEDEGFFSITAPEPLAVTPQVVNNTCGNSNDGSLNLEISGGTGPYMIQWLDGSNGPLRQRLPAGRYDYIVTDAMGCDYQDVIEVSDLDTFIVDITTQDLSCFEALDGRISITENRGQIDQIIFDQDGINTANANLSAGRYCLTIISDTGCAIDTCITISQPAPIRTTTSITNNICFGSNDGAIQLDILNGDGPFVINDGAIEMTTDRQVMLDDLAPGMYTFDIIDVRGCLTSTIVEVMAAEQVSIDAIKTDNDCKGQTVGLIEMDISGINDPFEVIWQSHDSIVREGRVISSLSAGSYTASIITSRGCFYTYTTSINEPEEAISATAGIVDVSCFGAQDGQINVSVDGAAGSVSYMLNNGPPINDNRFSNLDEGLYMIEVTDQSDCSFVISDISIAEPEEFIVSLNTDTFTYEFQDVDVVLTLSGAQGDYDLFWQSDPVGQVPCMSCDSFTIYNIESTVIVALESIDDAGCVAYDEKRIFVQRANHIEVPSAFSPNGDNLHDQLHVYGTPGAIIQEFKIYDREGVNLYTLFDSQTNQKMEGWDGIYRGEVMPAGTYMWTAHVLFPDGRSNSYSGSTHVLR